MPANTYLMVGNDDVDNIVVNERGEYEDPIVIINQSGSDGTDDGWAPIQSRPGI